MNQTCNIYLSPSPTDYLLSPSPTDYLHLYVACRYGHVDFVKTMLTGHFDLSIVRTFDAASPLYLASFGNHVEIVELLLDAGADVDQVGSKDGKTPLFAASEQGHIKIVEVLMERGADTTKTNNRGFRPLDIAIHHNHTDVANLLVHTVRWRRRRIGTRLLVGIGQRDRPKHSESGFKPHRRGGHSTIDKHAAAVAHTLFHLRVSRSRGAEVVSNTGRRVLEFL